MRKQWVALLSMLGLTSAGMPVRSQVVKGSSQSKTAHNTQVKAVNGNNSVQRTGGSSNLNLNQQTLRQQNNGVGGGKQADTMTPSAYCNKGNKDAGKQADTMTPSAYCNKGNANAVTKGSARNQLTPPPPGNNAVTKGSANNAVTKGSANNAVTKGSVNNAVTKGGNNAVTKGNNAVTKGSNAVTKGSAVQTTAAAGPH